MTTTEHRAPEGFEEPGLVLPRSALWSTLAGLAGAVAAAVAAAQVASRAGLPDEVVLAVCYAALFGLMLRTAVRAGRRWGTGRLSRDFGWSLTWADVPRGAGLAITGLTVSALVTAPFMGHELEANTSWMNDAGLAVVAGFAVVAVVAAPLVEELVFRGLLQRALCRWAGPGLAVAGQAVVFALGHLSPSGGLGNLPHFVHFSVWGAVMGVAAHRTGRLGPTIVAHSLSNCLAVAILLAGR